MSEMLNKSNYVDWDFVNIWDIQDRISLPTLRNMP